MHRADRSRRGRGRAPSDRHHGVEAAERIRDRALTQRDASRAETAEAKDSV